ncbi:MAG: enolase C-terminal domain-like protein [Acidimicrobiales bacterium]
MTPPRRLLPEGSSAVSCTIRLVSLPTVDQLAAAHDPRPAERRELTIVELVDAEGRSGFGECSALTRPGYTHEWARGAFDLLKATQGRPRGGAPMAMAGVEMARLDLGLRVAGLALSQHLHTVFSNGASGTAASSPPGSVPAGVVLPLATIDDTVAAAIAWAEQGVRRLKLKIEPGRVTEPVTAVHDACPGVELHVDANGSCMASDLNELAALAESGVTAIEQPFAPGDRKSSARLASSTSALVLADEAAIDRATIIELVDEAAATGVVIKPGRLGGLDPAIAVHDWCHANGVGVAAGGMLESGLGRYALAALASLPGFTITGDLSPARRWLADDPFADIEMVDGAISVPTTAGVAPPPDRELLDRFTLDRATFNWNDSDWIDSDGNDRE